MKNNDKGVAFSHPKRIGECISTDTFLVHTSAHNFQAYTRLYIHINFRIVMQLKSTEVIRETNIIFRPFNIHMYL